MKFTIIQEPKGQKRARGWAFLLGGKAIAGKSRRDEEELLEEKKLLALLYARQPLEPLNGPMPPGIKAYLFNLRSKSKKWQAVALTGDIRPTTKRDLDNCLRNLKDVCNGALGQNDQQPAEYLPGTGKYDGDPANKEIGMDSMDQAVFGERF